MPFVALAVLLGVVAVIQVTINRQVALRWGLGPAVLLNALVITIVAGAFLGLIVARGTSSFLLRSGLSLSEFRWYWLLPGVFGFLLVAGLPWAVHQIGALRVFVGLVAAQLVTSLVWDHFAESIPVTATRSAAALLAIGSVLLASWK